MKAGAESKTKLRLAIALLAVAVLTLIWTLRPSTPPAAEPAPAAPAAKEKAAQSNEQIDPRLHLDLLANSEDVKYEGKGINIFRAGVEAVYIPQPKVSPLRDANHDAKGALIPPPPPPINLKFFGLTNSKGEKPKVFLSQGDDVWIAHEGDVVNRHYKIVRISPTSIEVEDLLNNNRQNIPLTQG
jgi:hypothetical protein